MTVMTFLRDAFLLYVIGAFGMTLYLCAIWLQAKQEGLKDGEELTFSEITITILFWFWIILMLLID